MIDKRSGLNKIKSRIGLEWEAISISEKDNLYEQTKTMKEKKIACVLVDEVQFFTKEQMGELVKIVDELGIQVICYGLRADFKGELFPSITVLMAVADKIEEIKTVCWCGRKTIINARTVDGKIVYTGPQVQVGDSEYHSLCRAHWRQGIFHNPEYKEA